MPRKVTRQIETTPSKTMDEYLWNERLGIAQMPEIMPPTAPATPANTSSLPPQSSAAPPIEDGASVGQSDIYGTGSTGAFTPINPVVPHTAPPSAPAIGKAAAVTTDYGTVNPTPTIGENNPPSSGNGSQTNRNNSSENLPNGPEGGEATNIAPLEEGGSGLAADVGEAASIAALANKHWVGSVLDPVYANNDGKDDTSAGHYLFDSGVDPDEVLDAHNHGVDVENYVNTRLDGVDHDEAISNLTHSDLFGEDDLTEARVHPLPKCDFCDKKAGYDFKTKHGPWAYGCEDCYNEHKVPGLGLGSGKGQRLIAQSSKGVDEVEPKEASINKYASDDEEWEPISRQSVCAGCGKTIDEGPGENNHFSFRDKHPLYKKFGPYAVFHEGCIKTLDTHMKEASMNWNDRLSSNNEDNKIPWPSNNRSDIIEHLIKDHEPLIRDLMGDDKSRNQTIEDLRDVTSNPSPYGTDWTHWDLIHSAIHGDTPLHESMPPDHEHSINASNDRYAGKNKKDSKGHYKYIKKRGDKYVIIQKGTGKVLSTHDSKEKAIASFKAMEMSKHGG